MFNAQLLQMRRVRLAAAVCFLIVCLAWLFGPELIFLGIPVSDELLTTTRIEYWVLKTLVFLVGISVLFYVLLGRLGPVSGDKGYFGRLLNDLTVGVAYAEENGVLCFANPTFLRYFDLGPSVIGQVAIQDLIREYGSLPKGDVLPLSGKVEFPIRLRLSSGRELDLLASIQAEAASSRGYTVAVADMSELRRLRNGYDLTSRALDALPYGLAVCDLGAPGFPIVFANATTARMSGYPVSELVGAPWRLLQGTDDGQFGVLQMRAALEQGHPAIVSLRHVGGDGSVVLNEVEVTPVTDKNGKATHAVCLLRGVTSKAGLFGGASNGVWYDEITLLLSRSGFTHALEHMLSGSTADHVLLLKADIRNFHEFNTAVGWEAGDALLAEIGRRLSRALTGAAVGRMGADQYGLAVPVDLADVAEGVELVRHSIEGRYTIPGVTCDPLIAIGYTVCSVGTAARLALQQSSVALREACRDGAAGTRQFDQRMQREIAERRRLASELQRAVQDRNFVVEFLPEVDLVTGRIVSAEALVRWSHPLFGMQQPHGFIRLAEETGLILEIGELVLSQTTAFAARINRDRTDPITLTMNMSVAELRRPDIVVLIESTLDRSGAHPSWLQLDIAERTVATATADTLASMAKLRQLGIGLCIDNFGAGYCPLNLLLTFPMSKIKTASWFTRDVGTAGFGRPVLKAILDFGVAHGATVVAEGIETERERRILLDLGCTRGQGYLFSAPINGEDLERLLAVGDAAALLLAPAPPPLL